MELFITMTTADSWDGHCTLILPFVHSDLDFEMSISRRIGTEFYTASKFAVYDDRRFECLNLNHPSRLFKLQPIMI